MKPGTGFDVVREEYVNMEESGIVDPVKVTRIALQNAASVAGISLITEALVTDKPEETPAAPQILYRNYVEKENQPAIDDLPPDYLYTPTLQKRA